MITANSPIIWLNLLSRRLAYFGQTESMYVVHFILFEIYAHVLNQYEQEAPPNYLFEQTVLLLLGTPSYLFEAPPH
jgi:hypothetical protein